MSAKDPVLVAVDALAVELGIGADGLAFTWEQLEAVNGILDAYAHELAEKIRDRNNGVYGISGPMFAAEAADLIDPEASNNE
ncbi:hypothetical protein ACFPM3_20300 [Streptomyces coeruleoprunus]|uniref:Uncharacterized protein n=1 Tax=Streptomyces coeruleoprunus TaxID=285563 RepID=A0ABV9XHJ9_9ACTN